mgnify:CR=1 FL=1
MRDPLSNTVKEIKPSGIRKFFDVVSEMKDAISLGRYLAGRWRTGF